MLTIRLSRTGKRKQPYYRIVLQEQTRDPWSPAIEILGQLNPRNDRSEAELDLERIKYWLGKGAKPSKGLYNLFVDKQLIKGDKVNNISLTAKRRKAIEDAKPKAPEPKAEEVKVAEPAAEAPKAEAAV
ncbi:MAG: 30S ribosomal protein S16 [Patescibacteria group bacterium]